MNWHSVAEFLHMGGYAFYVWSSFGACAAAFAVEARLAARRRRAILAALRRAAPSDSDT